MRQFSNFDSIAEKKVFKHIESVWGKDYRIYPQLPFTKIFAIDTLNITAEERDYLLKTNIDYTICDINDKPIMCIEFDGWCHGFNKGGKYVSIIEDPIRKLKFELKLKIAIEHNYPFYIVSYDEDQKYYISEKNYLTVLDGIIGQTISRIHFEEKIKEYQQAYRFTIDSLKGPEQQNFIQDMVTSAEVELEMTFDPIVKRASAIETALNRKNIILITGHKRLSDPELPELKDMFDTEDFQKRLHAMKDCKRIGCEAFCETPKGIVKETVWIRNFESMDASPLTIVVNIADLLVFSKTAQIYGIKI